MSAAWTPNTPGIFFDLPEETYRQAPGVNVSAMKYMVKSPAHYHEYMTAPKAAATPAQVFGTLLHRGCLEPHRPADYAVKPAEINLRTKEGQAWKADQVAPIIDEEDARAIARCKTAIQNHPIARAILTGKDSRKEVSVFKVHEPTGLLLKGRLDVLTTDTEGNTVVVDLKTTDDASLDGFSRAIAKWRYAQQSAHYIDLVEAVFFTFIAIEKDAPHAIGIYSIDRESIEIGRQENERCLTLIAECQKTNKWPGYANEVQTIGLPRWAKFNAATE